MLKSTEEKSFGLRMISDKAVIKKISGQHNCYIHYMVS